MSQLSKKLQELTTPGLSNRKIASRAASQGHPIHHATVARYFRGDHPNPPKHEALQAIAAGTGIPLSIIEKAAEAPFTSEPFLLPKKADALNDAERAAILGLIDVMVAQKSAATQDVEFHPERAGYDLAANHDDEARPGPNSEMIGGPTPARHARVCLGLIYKRLIHDGLIEHSPVTYAHTPKEPRKLVEHVLTIEEIRAIRALIIDWGNRGSASGPKHGAQLLLDFVDVLAGTGMRPGEVLALRWADIDLTGGVIFVRSTLTRVKGQGLVAQPTPKSLYSQRGLAVPDFVVAILHRRYLEGDGRADTPVFATRNGTFISDSNMRRLWRQARAGRFEGVDFASYRKAVATIIERAEGMEAAGKALGHSSPDITRKYYVEREQVVNFAGVLGTVFG